MITGRVSKEADIECYLDGIRLPSETNLDYCDDQIYEGCGDEKSRRQMGGGISYPA